MKRFLTVAVAMLALTGMGQVAMRKLEDIANTNLVCVTDYGPQIASLTQQVTGLEGNTNAWSKTVANLASLSNNVASLSSWVDATNALFSAWFGSIFSSTSRWDTAYAWGDWHSAVEGKLDSAATNGWETGSHAAFLTSEADTNALAVIAAMKIKMRWDTSDANVYDTIEGGTNWVVYRIAAVPSATNYMVTLSDDFEDTITHTRPSWTNHVWPFNEEGWSGAEFYLEGTVQYVITPPVSAAAWSAITPFTLPAVLLPSGGAQGTATVSRVIVYPTNEIFRVDIASLTNAACHATTQYVAQAIADIPAPDLSAKLDKDNGTASNLTVNGFIALPQTAPTNLVLRLVCSNEHIYVEEVYP